MSSGLILFIDQTNNNILMSVKWITGNQCEDLRTGVMCSVVLVLVRVNLNELKPSNCVFGKTAGDEGMEEFLKLLHVKGIFSCLWSQKKKSDCSFIQSRRGWVLHFNAFLT